MAIGIAIRLFYGSLALRNSEPFTATPVTTLEVEFFIAHSTVYFVL